MQTIIDCLESAYANWPKRVAYEDENDVVTFTDLYEKARRIGSLLAAHVKARRPVAVIAERGVHVPAMYLGIAYAGCFYVPLATDQPPARNRGLLDFVEASVILTDGNCDGMIEALAPEGTVLALSQADSVDEAMLASRRRQMLCDDPLYVLFTSGSTGVPKGIITSQQAVMDVEEFIKTFSLGPGEIWGSQASFDYIASIRDIYIPLFTGAKTVIIPKKYFSTPRVLFEYVNKHGVTAICWAASALSLCCTLNVFEESSLSTIKKVFFAGSVLPGRHLRTWQENLPDALFVNHYGPTEITASCTYHVVDHMVLHDEVIPIGIPFSNREVFLLGEDGGAVPTGEKGEICVRGICLALGYYKDQEKTRKFFRDNPLTPKFPERIYKTGDIGSFRADGVLLFHGRADRQIKHMGYRIELEEIETAALALAGIDGAACLYDEEKDALCLFHAGKADKRKLALHLRKHLPGFMVPRKFVSLEALPRTGSGKVDFGALREMQNTEKTM